MIATTSRVYSVVLMGVGALALSVCACTGAAAASTANPDVVGSYARVLRSFNPRFSQAASRSIAEHILFISDYYNVDPAFVMALVNQESGWRSGAVSSAGAEGLGQLMPGTAAGLNVIPTDALENLDGTVRYIRRQLVSYGSTRPESRRYALALAAYNAGPGAVLRYHGIPPYRETINYVASIMASWERLQRVLPTEHAAAQTVIAVAARRLYVDLGARVSRLPVHPHAVHAVVLRVAPAHQTPAPAQPLVLPSSTPHASAAVPKDAKPLAPYDIAAFTGESLSSACGPENVIDPTARCGWDAVQSRGTRIGLILDLGRSRRTVQAVRIDFSSRAIPQGFEVATSGDPGANVDQWLGIRYCAVTPGSTRATCTIGDRMPRAIRIIIDGKRAFIRAVHLLPN